MRHALSLALLVVSLPALAAGEKTPRIPLRYEGLNQTKYYELKAVFGHPEQPYPMGHTAYLSKDGKFGLFAGGGGADIDGRTDESFLSLWDVPNGKTIKEIRIPGKAITSLTLDAEAKRALTGLFGSDGKGKDHTELVLWDLVSGKSLHRFTLPTTKTTDKKVEDVVEGYFAVAFSPDGKKALAAGGRGNVQLLNLDTGKVVSTFRPGKEDGRACLAVLFHQPDRAFLTWGSEVHLWDLSKNVSIKAYQGAKEEVLTLALSPDGKTLAAASFDPAIRVWDVATGAESGVLSREAANLRLNNLYFTGEKRQVLVASTGNDPATGAPASASITLWDPDAKKEVWSRTAQLQGLVPLVVREKRAVLGGGANLFCQIDLASGKDERLWGGHKSPVIALGTLKDRLLSGSQEGHLKAWTKSDVPSPLTSHGDAIFSIRVEGDQFLTTSADKTVKLWNAKAEVVQTYKGHTENVTGAVFGPGGKWIASAGGDRVIRTWERDTGKPIAVLSGHSEGINGLAISPDGKWLASASDDNSVRVWPVEDGKLAKDIDVVILEGHKRQVTTVAFTPDGKLLSGSQDKTIRIWDVAKQRTLRVMEGHQNWISSLLVFNDRAISTADDFRVMIWDLKKGKVEDVIDLTPYGDCPRSLALTDDGNGFYVGTSGWVIMRFELLKK